MKSTKICKGINKAHGFDGCGEEVEAKSRKYGLCPSCFWNWMQDTPEGKDHYENQFQHKVTKVKNTKEKERSKKAKIALTDWRKKLQTKVQEIVRLIDIGLPCLARNYHANQMHGGHVFSKGSNSTIALNLHNIHRQGAQSNHFQNDDGLLREGVAREYGEEYMNFISELRQSPTLKLTNLEYYEKYKLACEVSNLLKKRGQRFETDERIQMRNEINQLLGIYEERFCTYKKNKS